MWYNSGGWTADKPLIHLGLEPTTANHQDLNEWLKTGSARPLPAGGQVTWTLTMTVEEMD